MTWKILAQCILIMIAIGIYGNTEGKIRLIALLVAGGFIGKAFGKMKAMEDLLEADC